MITMPSLFGEKFFDDFFEDSFRPAYKPVPATTVMKTDIKETDDGFTLDIDLPGYTKDEVKGEIKDGYLTVSAFKSSETENKDEEGKYIRRERFFGNCSRSFYVGEAVTEEDIKAKFENGILKVFVPKKVKQPEVEEKKFISIEG